MFVKLLASSTAASAIVLRGMSYDTTNNKILMKGNALADNDLLYLEKGSSTDATVQGGLADKTVYMVSSQDDQGFKLKSVAKGTGNNINKLVAGTLVTLTTGTSGHNANTFTKVDAYELTSVDGSANKFNFLPAAPTGGFAKTDAFAVYCTTAANACVASLTTGGDALSADLTVGKTVYPHAIVDAAAAEIQLAVTSGGTQITHTGANDGNGTNQDIDTAGEMWLLKKSTTVKYAMAAAGSWDPTNNKIMVLHPFANDDILFYSASTVNTGLTNNGVYTARVTNNREFQLDGDSATTYANATPFTPDTTLVTFDGKDGKGGKFTKISASGGTDATSRILSGTATTNKWALGDGTATVDFLAEDGQVIFYCSDKTTATNCAFQPLQDGTSYKIKSVTGSTVILKGTTGSDAIAITENRDGSGTNKGWLLEKALYTASGHTTDVIEVAVVPANAGASAARGLAMFGSVVAMGAAFLMA